jgi:hypothetical protein
LKTKAIKAALEQGGKDNGGSGLRPEYGKHYYAAFLFDPDNYRIEAVINEDMSQPPDAARALRSSQQLAGAFRFCP